MIGMHSKYDNMHTNRMFYALICIINYIIVCMNWMLSDNTKCGYSYFLVDNIQLYDYEWK